MRMKWNLFLNSLLLVLLLPANQRTVWQVQDQKLLSVAGNFDGQKGTVVVPVMRSDLNQDGRDECLQLQAGVASIQDCFGKTLWQSPAVWQVKEAQITDLNRDGEPEVMLLVWRPFTPWPIDQDDPSGGRIKDFHNRDNESCHVILIHWARGNYNELWAGSALVRPVSQVHIADVDGDGWQELVALEGYYDSPFKGGSLTVWRWRGFGFVLEDEVNKFYQTVSVDQENGTNWIVTQ
ncbi:hypothetical protein SDC9_97811 [bioreactor metagenome]|uniref:FG-GAP repeat protein n=1 Tax=bioreactor metagenome TaxID=1076179 RepID=A0A645ACY1_9ZZZZ